MNKAIKKQVRITLQFTITADETAIPSGHSKQEREYNARQKRLLQAILSDQERFQAYLVFLATGTLECMNWQDWQELLLANGGESTRDVLMPSIHTLNESDQDFFHGAEQHGVFLENIEIMDECFSTVLEEANIEVQGTHAQRGRSEDQL